MDSFLSEDSPYFRELEVALHAVSVAAVLSLAPAVVDELADDKNVTAEKRDRTVVTSVDLAIQAVLTQVLSHEFPASRIIAEENADQLRESPPLLDKVHRLITTCAQVDARVWKDWRADLLEDKKEVLRVLDRAVVSKYDPIPENDGSTTWVIDPIDGTEAYIKGHHYAINLALLSGSQQALSVIACPLLDYNHSGHVIDSQVVTRTYDRSENGSLFFAVRGCGAYVQRLTHTFQRWSPFNIPRDLSKLSLDRDDGQRRLTMSYFSGTSGWGTAHVEITNSMKIDPSEISYLTSWVMRWVVLALGLANFTFWVYREPNRRAKIWDHAGAMMLFEEVGGKITDIEGKPIDLSAGALLSKNRGFVAAVEELHPWALGHVQDYLAGTSYPGFWQERSSTVTQASSE
ncbi:hypothetical protein QBC47DRAFT_370388 [Echria macrotheca]|uniref:Uncharacterized protein n=1 Tax=Echria macrotheca TaxID=438768 RepID=A0AAJ0BP15_9PEZI|nr:hypothetical protein QBC47DRAFT_370388 [Echria macrotheca]